VLLAQYWWEDLVLHGVAQYARECDWALDCRMRWAHDLPAEHQNYDGIIAYLGVTHPSQDIIDFIRLAQVPVVYTQSDENPLNTPKVIVPHEQIAEEAARHLLSLGFQNLGFVQFERNLFEDRRAQTFEKVVTQAGAEFHLLKRKHLAQALALLPKPIGLMVANDLNALEVIRICQDGGFRVPEDIAVVGVDDTAILCDLAPVPLSSVNCNFERQGYEAAALLDRLMKGEAAPDASVIIPPKGTTVRRSTDTIAISDPDAAMALRFLRDHYREPICIKHLTAELQGSLRRVQKAFRAQVGHTMTEELTRLRLDYARQLLRDLKLKIETVAHDSGFSNRFHFMRAFRRSTGESPMAFRRQFRKGGG
jgi:LacI family transcriptional regulator